MFGLSGGPLTRASRERCVDSEVLPNVLNVPLRPPIRLKCASDVSLGVLVYCRHLARFPSLPLSTRTDDRDQIDKHEPFGSFILHLTNALHADKAVPTRLQIVDALRPFTTAALSRAG